MGTDVTDTNRGAYGFRLVYPAWGAAENDLVELHGDTAAVTIEWRAACTIVTHDFADDTRVSMGARRGSSFHVRRDPASIVFDLEGPPGPDAVVHPLMTVPIAALARWRGDVTLHAGAFATSAGTWAVAGVRAAGKSTMLALLGERGFPVVADDLLTVLDGFVWSGPQCVDLRPDVAAHFPSARDMGIVGLRHRFRLSAPGAPPQTPLRGFFQLDWHERQDVTVTPLPVAKRLEWLYRMEYLGLLGPAKPERILDLAALPAWRVARPRSWEATEEALETLLEVTGG